MSGRSDPAIIVLGVDTPIGLTVLRELALAGFRVVALGWSRRALGLHSRFSHAGFVRERDEAALIAQLLDLADRYDAVALTTIGESDIDLINRHRPRLAQRLTLLVPEAEAMARVVNKDRCLAAAETVGIETPHTLTIDSLDGLDALLPSLRFPVVLKWANPHLVAEALGKRGIEVKKTEYAHDSDELRACLAPYCDVGAFPLIQEYCPGYGMGQMFVMRQGEPILRFQHRRIHEWPPEGGTSSLCESVALSEHADAQARSLALLRALDWEGVAMVEYRHDPATGRYVLMEINGRFWGSQPLAFHAGARFAAVWAASALGRPVAANKAPKAGIRCCYAVPETYRLIRVLFAQGKIALKSERFSRTEALVTYLAALLLPRTRFYVFWWRDPMPFLADIGFMARKALARSAP